MNTFDFLINNLDKEHKQKLIWFFNNKGKKIEGWLPTINGQNLASKAKGIYKPKDNQYALSVRSSLSSHYEDKLMRNDNGKFLFHYFQENLNPKERDLEYTNVAMKECIKDSIPIGVFVQIKAKPDPIYEIVGAGIVKSWDQGIFTIKGFNKNGEI